jgi:K+-transporting ATPase KdpF subunit
MNWSSHGFYFYRFDSSVRCSESADGRGLRTPEGKEMSGILIAGAVVAVGLLVYLLVALFNAEDFS